jgi:hypothetical protein
LVIHPQLDQKGRKLQVILPIIEPLLKILQKKVQGLSVYPFFFAVLYFDFMFVFIPVSLPFLKVLKKRKRLKKVLYLNFSNIYSFLTKSFLSFKGKERKEKRTKRKKKNKN